MLSKLSIALSKGCIDLQYMNLKVIMMSLAKTSGMKKSGLIGLRIKDLIPINDSYLINTNAGTPEEYTTFCTPKCKEMLDQYLKERKENGEKLTPKSKVFDNDGIEYSKCIEYRKAFVSKLSKSNVSSNDIEKLMGYKNGMKGLYYDPDDMYLFDEYKKAFR